MNMRTTLLAAAALVMGGVMLSGSASAAALKPGTYTVSIKSSDGSFTYCDIFTETLATDKTTVSGIHSFNQTSCSGYTSAPADGWLATLKKTIVQPKTGATWSLNDGAATVSEGYKLITYNLDLIHKVWAVYGDTGSGFSQINGGVLTWSFTPPGKVAPAPTGPTGNKPGISP
jgi:hypothetical protein